MNHYNAEINHNLLRVPIEKISLISITAIWLLLICVVGFTAECREGFAKTGVPSCTDSVRIPSLYGTYQVVDAERYRGGLFTTPAQAQAKVGAEKMVISKKLFSVGDISIVNPSYQLKCYYYPSPEGNIDTNRWSNFYGLGTHRRIIEVLEIYDIQETDEHPQYTLEVISYNEVWDTYDGFLYKLKKQKTIRNPRLNQDR